VFFFFFFVFFSFSFFFQDYNPKKTNAY